MKFKKESLINMQDAKTTTPSVMFQCMVTIYHLIFHVLFMTSLLLVMCYQGEIAGVGHFLTGCCIKAKEAHFLFYRQSDIKIIDTEMGDGVSMA